MRTTKGHPLGMLMVCAAVAVCIGTAAADWATATVATGRGPAALAVNPVTNKIYVANSGYYPDPSTVTVIDGATNDTATALGL